MSDRSQRAAEITRQMSGPPSAQSFTVSKTAFADEMSDILRVTCMEGLWAREGLDLRTRSLINVALLLSQRDHAPLAFHAPAAVRNGATVAELEEVVYHVTGYSGFPAGVTGREVIAEALRNAGVID